MKLFDKHSCTYCGELANTRDHIIPRTYSGDETFSHDVCVPACKECNCLLGPRAYFTIAERAHYIYNTLQKRYKKVLSSPYWKEKDIKELGNTLRSYVKKQQSLKLVIQERIERARLVSGMSTLTVEQYWQEILN